MPQSPRQFSTREWEYAVQIADLVTGPAFAFTYPDGTVALAVHIASADALTDDTRTELTSQLHTAIEETALRVLHCSRVATQGGAS